MPPKLLRSCSSFTTGVISGDSGSPLSCGYSIGSPNLRAKASCWCGVAFWSRRKMTRWSRNAWRISPTTSTSRSRDMSTPWISAPNAPGDRSHLDVAVVAHHVYPFDHGGGSLGHEGLDALRRLRPPQQADQAFRRVVEHGAIILRGAGQHQPLDGGQRLRLHPQDVVDQPLQRGVDLGRAAAKMAADAETLRLDRVDHPAGDRKIARRPLAQAPHDERNDLRGNEAHLGFGHAEPGTVVQDHHVRAAGHAEAAAHRRAFDDGDGRLRQGVERQQGVAELAIGRHQRIGRAAALPRFRKGRHVGHGVEVAAGAEMPARRHAAPARGKSGRRARGRRRPPAPASSRA